MSSENSNPTPPQVGVNVNVMASSLLQEESIDIPAPFRAAEAAMRRMEARYLSGEWSAEEYAAGLAKIVVKGDGVEWTIGASTGNWYRREVGGEWSAADVPTV